MTGMAVLGTGIFANSSTEQGGSNTPRIDKREVRQPNRIQQGTNSGQLTTKEALRLEKEQVRIQKSEAKAKSDSVVTKKERARITHKQNKASQHIYQAKHNKKTQ